MFLLKALPLASLILFVACGPQNKETSNTTEDNWVQAASTDEDELEILQKGSTQQKEDVIGDKFLRLAKQAPIACVDPSGQCLPGVGQLITAKNYKLRQSEEQISTSFDLSRCTATAIRTKKHEPSSAFVISNSHCLADIQHSLESCRNYVLFNSPGGRFYRCKKIHFLGASEFEEGKAVYEDVSVIELEETVASAALLKQDETPLPEKLTAWMVDTTAQKPGKLLKRTFKYVPESPLVDFYQYDLKATIPLFGTNTEWGHSGAPIFDDNKQVVGIVSWSFDKAHMDYFRTQLSSIFQTQNEAPKTPGKSVNFAVNLHCLDFDSANIRWKQECASGFFNSEVSYSHVKKLKEDYSSISKTELKNREKSIREGLHSVNKNANLEFSLVYEPERGALKLSPLCIKEDSPWLNEDVKQSQFTSFWRRVEVKLRWSETFDFQKDYSFPSYALELERLPYGKSFIFRVTKDEAGILRLQSFYVCTEASLTERDENVENVFSE